MKKRILCTGVALFIIGLLIEVIHWQLMHGVLFSGFQHIADRAMPTLQGIINGTIGGDAMLGSLMSLVSMAFIVIGIVLILCGISMNQKNVPNIGGKRRKVAYARGTRRKKMKWK